MNKKNTIKKTAAIVLGASVMLGATGCNFFPTNTELDMKQEIGVVDISGHVAEAEDGKYADYASALQTIVNDCGVDTSISKRDLVAYFLNAGTTYVESYGMSYRETFTMLMETLVTRKIMVQYAMLYFLAQKDDSDQPLYTAEGCQAFVQSGLEDSSLTETEKTLLQNNRAVLTMKYFLTENVGKADENTELYDKAVYSLRSAINDSLDSLETSFITEETGEDASAPERTLPTGVDTQKEDYYTADYDIYTGRNTLDSCGDYEALDGSTPVTRLNAYNKFLSNLDGNYLLLEGENTSNFTELNYYYVELSSQLEQAIITKLNDTLTEEAYKNFTDAYVAARYDELLESQETKFTGKSGISNFGTAIDAVSDESFVLYSPAAGYGFVYNILIPFSTWQEQQYSIEKARGLTQKELYAKRANILTGVKAKDLRGDWFSNFEDYNYSYVPETDEKYYTNTLTAANTTNYLFFKNNSANSDKYESLGQYYGKYAYNGTVTTDADGEFKKFTPNPLSIDDFIVEMNNYLNYAIDGDVNTVEASGTPFPNYVKDGNYSEKKNEQTGEVTYDYSEFMYYTGSVDVGTTDKAEYFKEGTKAYKAVSAINELMFAYSTDPGCLNTYMGYSVSPFTTSYVKEFEYAAQYAVSQGVGNYAVCATDFGWHVIYVSYVYDAVGEVYTNGYVAADRETEGTFSYMFYEYLKNEVSEKYMQEIQTVALQEYNASSVTKFEDRYEDLLSIGE
ncbi:MAG: hypothetical protein IJY38_02100 [Clostridia bacterium]|nr:hypothetical protein [Clostridia bacterium]